MKKTNSKKIEQKKTRNKIEEFFPSKIDDSKLSLILGICIAVGKALHAFLTGKVDIYLLIIFLSISLAILIYSFIRYTIKFVRGETGLCVIKICFSLIIVLILSLNFSQNFVFWVQGNDEEKEVLTEENTTVNSPEEEPENLTASPYESIRDVMESMNSLERMEYAEKLCKGKKYSDALFAYNHILDNESYTDIDKYKGIVYNNIGVIYIRDENLKDYSLAYSNFEIAINHGSKKAHGNKVMLFFYGGDLFGYSEDKKVSETYGGVVELMKIAYEDKGDTRIESWSWFLLNEFEKKPPKDEGCWNTFNNKDDLIQVAMMQAAIGNLKFAEDYKLMDDLKIRKNLSEKIGEDNSQYPLINLGDRLEEFEYLSE